MGKHPVQKYVQKLSINLVFFVQERNHVICEILGLCLIVKLNPFCLLFDYHGYHGKR